MTDDRVETLRLLDEAEAAGARLVAACRELGLSVRTVQRWRLHPDGGQDFRRGPKTVPGNRLSDEERLEFLRVANAPENRNLTPKKVVPKLADQGIYLGSESTLYRILRNRGLLSHRSESKPRSVVRPEELVTTGPCQVWSWDITYLPATARGTFYYLYLFIDVWSRRIMKAVVHDKECAEFAATCLAEACTEHRIDPNQLALHSDNGGPMKGATMLATMQSLGVVPSFSRPSVSNDNPFSESLFRTLKYVPAYPRKPFDSVEAAWAWVERFVSWYNGEHLHSSIGFVSPNDRHQGRDIDVLTARRKVYSLAKAKHPARWSRNTRQWDAPAVVALNPRAPETKARTVSMLRVGVSKPSSMAPPTATTVVTTLPRRHDAMRMTG